MTNLTQCLAYLAKLPPAVSGSGGHSATLRAACECVRFGLTDSEAMQALAEYNRRCSPPWSERELAHKVTSARKLAGGQAGVRARSNTGRRRGSVRVFDRAAHDRAPAEKHARRPVETRFATHPAQDTLGDSAVLVAPVAQAVAPCHDDPTSAETIAIALRDALRLVEERPDFVPGRPVIRQSVEVEETFWREVWRRLNVPDPGLSK